jgi:small GTP-binding protein
MQCNIPTVFEDYATCRELLPGVQASPVGVDSVIIQISDTSGMSDYDRLRPLAYPKVDFFMVCFNIGCRDSLENLYDTWMPELAHYVPGKQFAIVGCQKDQRIWPDPDSIWGPPVSEEEGRKAAKKLGALGYFECSAITGEGIEEVFENCCGLALGLRLEQERTFERRGCSVM